jgi:hypothetical protein
MARWGDMARWLARAEAGLAVTPPAKNTWLPTCDHYPVLPHNFPPHLPALPRVLDHPALDLSVQPDGHGLQAMLPLRCSPALDAVTFRHGMPPLREVADAWLCRYCDTAMIPVRQGGCRAGEGVRVSSAILEPGSRNDFLLGIESSLIGNVNDLLAS